MLEERRIHESPGQRLTNTREVYQTSTRGRIQVSKQHLHNDDTNNIRSRRMGVLMDLFKVVSRERGKALHRYPSSICLFLCFFLPLRHALHATRSCGEMGAVMDVWGGGLIIAILVWTACELGGGWEPGRDKDKAGFRHAVSLDSSLSSRLLACSYVSATEADQCRQSSQPPHPPHSFCLGKT